MSTPISDDRWLLRFLAGPRQGDVLTVPIGVEQQFGRDGVNGILLADDGVSRHHATIAWQDDEPVLFDEDSLNGTFVNGQPVTRQVLRHWDLIVVAASVLRIESRIVLQAAQGAPISNDARTSSGNGTGVYAVRTGKADDEHLVEVLLSIQAVLSAGGDGMVERCLESLFAVLPATHLALIDVAADGTLTQGYTITPHGPTTENLGQGFARQVLAAGVPLLMEDATGAGGADWGRTLADQKVRSILGAPVPGPDGPVAVLLCDNRERPGTLRERHRRLVEFAARALGNAFQRRQVEELGAARAEMAAAKRVQERLVSRDPTNLPGAWTWCVHYEPAASVGGDFYDYHRTATRTTWVVADVSGHGVSAALVVSMLKAFTKTLYALNLQPSEFLTRLNHLLVGELPPAMFVTAVVMTVEDEGAVVIAGAGHPPALVVRSSGVVETVAPGRGLLGFPLEVGFLRHVTDVAIHLLPGDRIVLYSDGVTEAGPPANQYGHRLEALLTESAVQPLLTVRERILAAVHAYQGGPLPDDVTLVIGERNAG